MRVIPTRHNGLFTTNRGDLEYPSLWDGLELAYFPHNDGGGGKLKGYGRLATDATLHGTYSWIGSEIGKMWKPDGSSGYANTNNTSFVNKIDTDFSHMMWTHSAAALTNNDRWWGTEDVDGPRLYALVKDGGSTAIRWQIVAWDDEEEATEQWYTSDTDIETGVRPVSFICSVDWSTEDATMSANGGSVGVTTTGGGAVGVVDECDQPIFIGARNIAGSATKHTSGGVSFSTIAWWSRQLSQAEHRILGNDPFVLCRRRAS